MKPKGIIIKAFLWLVVASFTTHVQAKDDVLEGIEVVAEAKVALIANKFSVKLTLAEQGVTAQKTKSIVDQKLKQIINGLHQLGIEDQDISSSKAYINTVMNEPSITFDNVEVLRRVNKQNVKVNTKVNSKQNYNHSDKSQMKVEVSRFILVNLNDMSQYDKLYDNAIKRGVTQISDVVSSYSSTDELYETALGEALKKAKNKAKKLALLSQKSVGDIIAIKELSTAPNNLQENKRIATEINKGRNVERYISARVKVKFTLNNQK